MHPDFIAAYNAERGPRTYTLDEFRQRFIDRQEWDGDCLIWQGTKDSGGYGSVSVLGKTMLAHRAAYWMNTGQRPPVREPMGNMATSTRRPVDVRTDD